jgi:hypothetical protein
MVVSLTVVSEDPNAVTRAAEVMARAAAGLALERIMVSLTLGTPDEDEADT